MKWKTIYKDGNNTMNQHITPEQLEIFNRYFNIQQFKQNVEYRTHEKITNQNLSEYLLGNKELFEQPINHSENKKTIFYITSKLHPFGNLAKPISYIRDIKDFILNEMNDFIKYNKTLKGPTIEEKIKLFNKHFTIELVENKEYYLDYPDLNMNDMELVLLQDLKNDENKGEKTNLTSSTFIIHKGTKRIKEVRTMREVREFIESEMYFELPLWEIANYGK